MAEPKNLATTIGSALLPTIILYLPAIKRMVQRELKELSELLDEGNADAAYELVASKMTLDELAREKSELRILSEACYVARVENIVLANEIGMAVLKAVITILLAAAVV